MRSLPPRTVAVFLWVVVFAGGSIAQAVEPLFFTDVTESSGIDFSITQAPPLTGTGVVVADIDKDGLYDLIFSGGVGQPMAVYRNEGGLKFSLVSSEESGFDGFGGDPRGLAAADYDNDGDVDIFVANWAIDQLSYLFRNDNGKFVEVATTVGVLVDGDASSGSWADYDNDGWLDLYVTRYWSGQNLLFRNQGDGTFVDVTTELGLHKEDGALGTQSFQSIWLDIDRDGDVDLYEMNDRCYNGYAPNYLWINESGTGFVESAAEWGLDHCFDAMGIGLADMNRDGFLDMFMTNVPDGHLLLQGGCDGYMDVTGPSGTLSYQWGWGVIFADLNHDTWPDLYIAHAGYVSFERENRLLMNQGDGTFLDVSDLSDASGGSVDSAAVVRADLDGDGDEDLVVANLFQLPFKILRNDGPTKNYLRVRLEGVDSNRDGLGTWVEVLAGGIWHRALRQESSVFYGRNAPDLLFGLGDATQIQRVVVHWPSGVVQVLENLEVNHEILVVEAQTEGGEATIWKERCGDGVDNDCDGAIDEGFAVGVSCSIGVGACIAEGVTVCSSDAMSVNCEGIPLTPIDELGGDGIDNDCDGEVDEVPDNGVVTCVGTVELCGDGIDNDCNGETDEGFTAGEFCEIGVGTCVAQGVWQCSENLLDVICDGEPSLPEQEICGDGFDNDCDGETDEGFPLGNECIGEKDGCSFLGHFSCGEEGLSVQCLPDSLEDLPVELCGDEVDNDCDGVVDEGFPVGGVCWAGTGICRRKGAMVCSDDLLGVQCDAVPGAPSEEIGGDGLDNDCDGVVDELEAAPIMPDVQETELSGEVNTPTEPAVGCSSGGASRDRGPAAFWFLCLVVLAVSRSRFQPQTSKQK